MCCVAKWRHSTRHRRLHRTALGASKGGAQSAHSTRSSAVLPPPPPLLLLFMPARFYRPTQAFTQWARVARVARTGPGTLAAQMCRSIIALICMLAVRAPSPSPRPACSESTQRSLIRACRAEFWVLQLWGAEARLEPNRLDSTKLNSDALDKAALSEGRPRQPPWARHFVVCELF